MSLFPMSLPDNSSQCPVKSLPVEYCIYRGEGNANLVVALISERKVIRLKKSEAFGTSRQENAQGVYREVNFIRDIISGFLPGYVCVPEIERYDQTEIARLSEKIRLARPESRRNKEIVAGYSTVFPDYTFLPPHLSTFSIKPTFCVEIKPKQGFICELDRRFRKCPYCLMQYRKLHSGLVEEVSNYCPFDLFSGKPERMDRAIQALLRSPQNNLRIFKDGVLWYEGLDCDEEKLFKILADWFSCSNALLNLERFLLLVKTALMRSFQDQLQNDGFADVESSLGFQLKERYRREAAALEIIKEITVPSRLQVNLATRVSELLSLLDKECEFTDGDLPSGSVLERILQMQKLHLCGADAVAWIHANCSTFLTEEILYDDLLNPSPRPTEFTKSKSPHKSQHDRQMKTDQSCLQHLTEKDCIDIIQNYLLFCTAKDCSILMAFQEIDKEISKKSNSDHTIELSVNGQQHFLVNVRVIDLDMKGLQSIKKHCARDNDVLQAAVKELEKQINI